MHPNNVHNHHDDHNNHNDYNETTNKRRRIFVRLPNLFFHFPCFYLVQIDLMKMVEYLGLVVPVNF